MASPEEYINEVVVVGSASKEAGIQELDLLLIANSGSQYSVNVMTQARFEEAQSKQLDLGYDPEAPRIYVIEADHLAFDALDSIFASSPVSALAPYVYKLEEGRDE